MIALIDHPNTGIDKKKPTARRRAKRLSPEARRAQLLETAVNVIADHGVGRTNHSQIAEAAEVSLQTVFVYFHTHEELTLAVVDKVARFLKDDVIVPALTSDIFETDVIEGVLLAFAESIESHRDYTRIWLDWSTSMRGRVWQRFQVFNWEAAELVQDAIRQEQAAGRFRPDIDAADAAQVVVGLGHMIAQMVFGGVPRIQLRRILSSLVGGYLKVPQWPERDNA